MPLFLQPGHDRHSMTYTMETWVTTSGDACVCPHCLPRGSARFWEESNSQFPVESSRRAFNEHGLVGLNVGRKGKVDEKLSAWALCDLVLLESLPAVCCIGSLPSFPGCAAWCASGGGTGISRKRRLLTSSSQAVVSLRIDNVSIRVQWHISCYTVLGNLSIILF